MWISTTKASLIAPKTPVAFWYTPRLNNGHHIIKLKLNIDTYRRKRSVAKFPSTFLTEKLRLLALQASSDVFTQSISKS